MTYAEITAVIHEHIKKRTKIVDQMSAAKQAGNTKEQVRLNRQRETLNKVIQTATTLRSLLESSAKI